MMHYGNDVSKGLFHNPSLPLWHTSVELRTSIGHSVRIYDFDMHKSTIQRFRQINLQEIFCTLTLCT